MQSCCCQFRIAVKNITEAVIKNFYGNKLILFLINVLRMSIIDKFAIIHEQKTKTTFHFIKIFLVIQMIMNTI